ncbi:hypothetical protein SNEBB_001453 [Seison nebaliae]|nr:hypothetical protein SNEBB_001453 [Seison nebaliae]
MLTEYRHGYIRYPLEKPIHCENNQKPYRYQDYYTGKVKDEWYQRSLQKYTPIINEKIARQADAEPKKFYNIYDNQIEERQMPKDLLERLPLMDNCEKNRHSELYRKTFPDDKVFSSEYTEKYTSRPIDKVEPIFPVNDSDILARLPKKPTSSIYNSDYTPLETYDANLNQLVKKSLELKNKEYDDPVESNYQSAYVDHSLEHLPKMKPRIIPFNGFPLNYGMGSPETETQHSYKKVSLKDALEANRFPMTDYKTDNFREGSPQPNQFISETIDKFKPKLGKRPDPIRMDLNNSAVFPYNIEEKNASEYAAQYQPKPFEEEELTVRESAGYLRGENEPNEFLTVQSLTYQPIHPKYIPKLVKNSHKTMAGHDDCGTLYYSTTTNESFKKPDLDKHPAVKQYVNALPPKRFSDPISEMQAKYTWKN